VIGRKKDDIFLKETKHECVIRLKVKVFNHVWLVYAGPEKSKTKNPGIRSVTLADFYRNSLIIQEEEAGTPVSTVPPVSITTGRPTAQPPPPTSTTSPLPQPAFTTPPSPQQKELETRVTALENQFFSNRQIITDQILQFSKWVPAKKIGE
jgi:hypothetical protein